MKTILTVLILTMCIALSPSFAGAEDLESLYQPYEGENRNELQNPHRSTGELAEWLISTVGQLFTINAATMKQDLLNNQSYFSPSAFKSYLKFLQNSGYLPVMEAQNLNMTGISQTTAQLDRKGVVQGRYSWIYRVPITIILSSALDDPSVVLPKPEDVDLKVQIIRADEAREPHKVVIIGMVREKKEDTEADF